MYSVGRSSLAQESGWFHSMVPLAFSTWPSQNLCGFWVFLTASSLGTELWAHIRGKSKTYNYAPGIWFCFLKWQSERKRGGKGFIFLALSFCNRFDISFHIANRHTNTDTRLWFLVGQILQLKLEHLLCLLYIIHGEWVCVYTACINIGYVLSLLCLKKWTVSAKDQIKI